MFGDELHNLQKYMHKSWNFRDDKKMLILAKKILARKGTYSRQKLGYLKYNMSPHLKNKIRGKKYRIAKISVGQETLPHL